MIPKNRPFTIHSYHDKPGVTIDPINPCQRRMSRDDHRETVFRSSDTFIAVTTRFVQSIITVIVMNKKYILAFANNTQACSSHVREQLHVYTTCRAPLCVPRVFLQQRARSRRKTVVKHVNTNRNKRPGCYSERHPRGKRPDSVGGLGRAWFSKSFR